MDFDCDGDGDDSRMTVWFGVRGLGPIEATASAASFESRRPRGHGFAAVVVAVAVAVNDHVNAKSD